MHCTNLPNIKSCTYEECMDLPSATSIPQIDSPRSQFDEVLSPYEITSADKACELSGGCYVVEKNIFIRVITGITCRCIIGYKCFDFGVDYSGKTMEFHAKVSGMGCISRFRILLDDAMTGEEIGTCDVGMDDGVVSTKVKNVTGIHGVYFVVEDCISGYFYKLFKGRQLFELISFVFTK